MTGASAWVRSMYMKRVIATAVSLAIALVAPATASASVQVTFKTWKVETKNGKQHNVAPGGTFNRCGRKVVKLHATYDYSGATVGKPYQQIWKLDGTELVTRNRNWAAKSGTVHVNLFKQSGNALDDGRYTLRLQRPNGERIKRSSISVKPGTSC